MSFRTVVVRHRWQNDARGGIIPSTIGARLGWYCCVGQRRFGRAFLDFHGKPRTWGTLRRACISEPRDATTLVREFRPLGFAASDRRDQSAATRGALCTCVKLTRSSSLSLSSSISPLVHPRSPVSFARSSLYAPVIQHDGGCVYPALPLPFLFVSVTLSRSLSPLSPRTPSLSAVHFLPRTERISSVLSRRILSLPPLPLFTCSFGYASLPRFGCKGSRVAKRCHFYVVLLSASTKGGRTLDNI